MPSARSAPSDDYPGARTAQALTRPARRIAATGAALILAGLLIGVVPLVACGASLACAVVLARLTARAAVRNTSVRRRISQRTVVEGEVVEATIVLRGLRLHAVGATVEDPLSGASHSLSDAGWRRVQNNVRELQVIAIAGRRGPQRFPAPQVLVSDPLGIVYKRASSDAVYDELLVLPRVESVQWSPRGWAAVHGEQAHTRGRPGVGEVNGLREYREGTPATRIHWQSLARGSGLLERQLTAAGHSHPRIVLDNGVDAGARGTELLDVAVRAAASLCNHLGRSGVCTIQLPGHPVPLTVGPGLHGWDAVHARLALLMPAGRRGARLPQGPASSGPLLYVSVDRPGPEVRQHAGGALVHVLPAAVDNSEREPLFTVAGCNAHNYADTRPVRAVA